MSQSNNLEQMDLFEAQIIPLRLAITAMRDSGYRNTAYALAELIDNSVQAKATNIEILCIEKRITIGTRHVRRLLTIGVLDNGSGMDKKTLRMALQFGNGTRLDDRTGIGRFGMGLPNSSISQAARVDVWSWQNGPGNSIHTYIDLDEIETQNMFEVPEPAHYPVPDSWREIADNVEENGTLVVWSKLDFSRLTWKRAERALLRTEEIIGRIYRKFILEDELSIRMYAMEQGVNEPHIDRSARINDPLYLVPSAAMLAPFNTQPMFEFVFEEDHLIEYGEKKSNVKVTYSVATTDTVDHEANTNNRGDTKYGIHAKSNIGVSVVRARREIVLDNGWCIGYDPRERWWGAEVHFQPELDEVFGVTNNKQAATHLQELATTHWTDLKEEEEEDYMDVVDRLKREGDPRGSLLQLSNSIRRNLNLLRDMVKAQGSGRRSSGKQRHSEEPDEATQTTNQVWKERSARIPLKDEDAQQPSTQEELEEIKTDLTENLKYDDKTAASIVSLIKDADLKVLFLESDFPDRYNLFNVEIKGNITEIVFNRKHPAFDDIFGTLTTGDEDINSLSTAELIERLTRACNSTKVIFAAWARYEREAGVDSIERLRRDRFNWGQIASVFLEPEVD